MKLAVFDSGIGGLTVVRSLINDHLFEEIIYFGDTARVPYGTKDANTVIRYALEALEFFQNFEIDMMLVACNTASAYALEELRRQAPYDVHGVIEPGVLALKRSGIKSDDPILVIATPGTVNSGLYQKLLEQSGYTNVTAIPTALFVPLVEERIEKDEILLPVFEHYFAKIEPPKAVIMGCTHFPLLEAKLQAYFKSAKLIHSGEAIVEYLSRNYVLTRYNKAPKLQLFASENANHLKSVAKSWLGALYDIDD